jgi:hypothetical protein
MTYYNAMALKKLGRESEATSLLIELQRYASKLARQQPKIDYFATSLPSMLLFDESLEKRNMLTAKFLQSQAALGLDRINEASRLLEEVLASDPSHALAWDLRQEMNCQAAFEKSWQVRS